MTGILKGASCLREIEPAKQRRRSIRQGTPGLWAWSLYKLPPLVRFPGPLSFMRKEAESLPAALTGFTN